jgi:hypothetical protein
VLDTLVREGKLAVERMLEADVLLPWTVRNWGESAADLVPRSASARPNGRTWRR